MASTNSTEYGALFTLSDTMNSILENYKTSSGDSTWSSLFNALNDDYQSSYDSLTHSYKVSNESIISDYNDALAEAYASSLRQKGAVYQTDVVGEARAQQLADIDSALKSAYETYQSNLASSQSDITDEYNTNLSTLQSNYQSSYNTIYSELEDEATNTNSFYNSLYQYLQYIYDTYSDQLTKENYALYLQSLEDDNGLTDDELSEISSIWSSPFYNYLTYDEEDDSSYRLKTWNELVSSELFDSSTGKSTERWKHFVDMILNEVAQHTGDATGTYGTTMSYGNWLATNNADLLTWLNSESTYNYTDDLEGTHAGTNLATILQQIGLADDDTYTSNIEKVYTNKQEKTDVANYKAEKAGEEAKENIVNNTASEETSAVNSIRSTLSNVITNFYNNSAGQAKLDWADMQKSVIENGDIITSDADKVTITSSSDYTAFEGKAQGMTGNDQNTYMQAIVDDAKAGKIQNGQIILANEGSILNVYDNLYIYWNGTFIELNNMSHDITLDVVKELNLYIPAGYSWTNHWFSGWGIRKS